jgi:hypothetical protein
MRATKWIYKHGDHACAAVFGVRIMDRLGLPTVFANPWARNLARC